MASGISGSFGELRIETDQIEVTSNPPKPDKNWRYTDQQGHEHYWQDGYPTLVTIVDKTYWCGECRDEHEEMHLECPICHEHITPGMVGPSGFREFVPGRTSYWLNGKPISEERAKLLIAETRST
jgi:hypothetical protein